MREASFKPGQKVYTPAAGVTKLYATVDGLLVDAAGCLYLPDGRVRASDRRRTVLTLEEAHALAVSEVLLTNVEVRL